MDGSVILFSGDGGDSLDLSRFLQQADIPAVWHARSIDELTDRLAVGDPVVVVVDCSTAPCDPEAIVASIETCRPATPILFVLVSSDAVDASSALASGAADYVFRDRLQYLVPRLRRALAHAVERCGRHNVETALKTAEERYRLLVENVRDYALFMTDSETRVTTWNTGAERIFGYSGQEIVGRAVAMLFLPEERDWAPKQELAEALEFGRAINERWFMRRDGSLFWASGVLAPVFGDQGRVEGFVKILRDNTSQKQAEEERQRLLVRERLAREEAEARSRELERVNRELERFVFISSHDLKEPLRMVKIYAQMLVRRFGGHTDEDAQTCIRFIEEGVTRMQNLIDDSNAYSRVLYEDHEPQVVDLNSTLAAVLEECKDSIVQTGAHVLSHNLPSVQGDKPQLQLLFRHLIGNALKYRSDRPPVIDIAARAEDAHWVFTVSDNGIGFEKQHSRHIFGLFKRLHRNYPGTGLGLALVKRIVERHGGCVWAESDPGCGARFCFTLPQYINSSAEREKIPLVDRL
jgi:PAS domain S-box-containing protein